MDKENKLSMGDVVSLKSGSPNLTVTDIGSEDIRVTWFEQGDFKAFVLPIEAVVKAK